MHRRHTVNLTFSALFLALAYLLPFLTGQIQQFGNMLCPMHIPVLLCGFVCGWPWGLAVGFVAPLLRSLVLGMPMLFPSAVCMAVELAVYGAVCGALSHRLPQKIGFTYLSLVAAMIVGRVVWGGAMWLCLGVSGGAFTLSAFFAGAITNALPGIVLQLVLVPPIATAIRRLGSKRRDLG